MKLVLKLIMSFILNNRQDIFVDKAKSRITFQTLYINGQDYYFHLSPQQFEAMDDAIIIINKHSHLRHFPLGQNMWLHYNGNQKTQLYVVHSTQRPFFKFEHFNHYKNNIHRKVMSLLRSVHDNELRKRGRGRRRLQRQRRQRERSIDEAHQCTYSNEVQSSHRHTENGIKDRREQAVFGATDDVDMSTRGDASPILSKRYNTSPWRECEEKNIFQSASSDPSSSSGELSDATDDYNPTVYIE